MIKKIKSWFMRQYCQAEREARQRIYWTATNNGTIVCDARDIMNCTAVQKQIKDMDRLRHTL